MAHKTQDTATTEIGLENALRSSWRDGSKVRILSTTSHQWVPAHIVTMHKDWLYCLLEDGDTKKIDRWDATVQPYSTNTSDGGGEDDEDEFWMKDSFGSSSTPNLNGQSMSLGFNTLKANIGNDDFTSTQIVKNNDISALLAPSSSQQQKRESIKKIGNALTAEEKQFNKMCGYTVWVQWCDSTELHGYYQCVGLRNNRYHFKHRKDDLAELFADDKGYWYLMYDSKCLYKSKKKGHDDPPPRNWKCIEGSLPPPGVSTVDLPDDSTPMVILDEDAKEQSDLDDLPSFNNKDENSTQTPQSDVMSNASGFSRATTVRHHETTETPLSPKKKKKKKKKKTKKNKLNVAKLLMDEFEVAIDVLDFHFDGSKAVAFHLNIARHMEVTKVKSGGQAEKLGVLQGDILLKINDEDISKNWEKATSLLRSHVANKETFSITFVRRKVENLIISVVRAGNGEFNGKYKFYKRDVEDDECPIYVKNDHDEDFDFDDLKEDKNGNKMDPLTSNSESIHIIQRVYCDAENFEALWVLKNGKDEHYYMCVTNEYLPPQHGWELVPDSSAKYPAPGLQFTSSANRFDHVDRMKSHQNDDDDDEDEKGNADAIVHDALNISNRNRTNQHRHEKTLTRMRASLANASDFNKMGKQQKRAHTGGASGYMPPKVGMKMGGKRGGFGSQLFRKNKKPKASKVVVTASKKSDGNESAPETDDDTAKIEAIWKQKLEQTTKNAINNLNEKHKDEIHQKEKKVGSLKEIVNDLRGHLAESSEYYYQQYLDKCTLSLILQEKQIELKRSKEKQKEMGKRYFMSQQRTEELESKLNEISHTFSSRMSQIQSAPKTHRPTKSTVSDLASIEEQFRNLLKEDNESSHIKKVKNGHDDDQKNDYMEDEIIRLNEKINELTKYKSQVQKLKNDNKVLTNQLANNAKQGGKDQFYQERANKLSHKVGVFQQNIYALLSLLQNVEQEYMQKCGKLPKVTRTIDWRNEYDPKKYKYTNTKNMNGAHPTNNASLMQINQSSTTNYTTSKKKKKSKKPKISKHAQGSATYSMTLPDNERYAGFNLGSSGDEEPKSAPVESKPKHRGNQNQSIFMDL